MAEVHLLPLRCAEGAGPAAPFQSAGRETVGPMALTTDRVYLRIESAGFAVGAWGYGVLCQSLEVCWSPAAPLQLQPSNARSAKQRSVVHAWLSPP